MQHAGGVREVSGYTTPRYSVTYARTAERTAGATQTIRGWGDGGALPAELAVTLFVQDDTAELSDAYDLAYDIIAEAETASEVTTHAGQYAIAGLLGYDVRPDGLNALLTLRFAAAGPGRVIRALRGHASVTGATPTISTTENALVRAASGAVTATGFTPNPVGETMPFTVMAGSSTVMAGTETVIASPEPHLIASASCAAITPAGLTPTVIAS